MDYLQMEFLCEQKGYSISELAQLTNIPIQELGRILGGGEVCADFKTLLVLEKILTKEENCIREPQPYYGSGKHTLQDYYALPEEKRYELIDGEFFRMQAPEVLHQRMSREVSGEIWQYIRKNHGECEALSAPCDVQLDGDEYTMVQPDIIIVCDSQKVTDRCIVGAPDFIVEILSPAARKKDITIKQRKYRMAGVREYWMIDLEKGHVIVYFFEKSELPVIYGMKERIPVGIYAGKLVIDFDEIFARIKNDKLLPPCYNLTET